MTVALVTGLRREARIAARAGLHVDCAGPGPHAARRTAERLVAGGATALVSFGYAGGLDPTLVPGDLIVAERVVAVGGQEWATQGAAALADRVPSARIGISLGTDAPIATVDAKAALARRAMAVDMESHAIAAVAAARRIPFLVVRAIVDPAGRTLPDAALAATADDGTPRLGRLMAALAARPQDIGAIVALAVAMRRADRALAVGAVALGQL